MRKAASEMPKNFSTSSPVKKKKARNPSTNSEM